MAQTADEILEDVRARLVEVEREHWVLTRVKEALARGYTPPKGLYPVVPPKGVEKPVPAKGEDTLVGAARAAQVEATRKRGRPKGSGKRQAQIIQILSHGALTTRETSEQLGLKSPNYLYRVLPDMQGQGIVRKRDDGRYELDPDRPQVA